VGSSIRPQAGGPTHCRLFTTYSIQLQLRSVCGVLLHPQVTQATQMYNLVYHGYIGYSGLPITPGYRRHSAEMYDLGYRGPSGYDVSLRLS
jgi:hypothetical protein